MCKLKGLVHIGSLKQFLSSSDLIKPWITLLNYYTYSKKVAIYAYCVKYIVVEWLYIQEGPWKKTHVTLKMFLSFSATEDSPSCELRLRKAITTLNKGLLYCSSNCTLSNSFLYVPNNLTWPPTGQWQKQILH